MVDVQATTRSPLASAGCGVQQGGGIESAATEGDGDVKAAALRGGGGSAGLGVAKPAIGLQALVAAVQQFAGLEVADLAQRIRERA